MRHAVFFRDAASTLLNTQAKDNPLMRTSTSKAALVALATAAFALPAFAQTYSTDNATNPPAATASPTNPAPAPSAQMDQDKSASPGAQTDMNNPPPSAKTDVNKDNSVAAAPDMGAAAAVGGHRASQIIGTAVVNSKDESIGKVDDILIGPERQGDDGGDFSRRLPRHRHQAGGGAFRPIAAGGERQQVAHHAECEQGGAAIDARLQIRAGRLINYKQRRKTHG